jgi:hypothetical protein
MIGVFFAIWPAADYAMFIGVFGKTPDAGYMLRFALFAAFAISAGPFLPEFSRSVVIFYRQRALNQ